MLTVKTINLRKVEDDDPTPADAGQGITPPTNYPTTDGRKWDELSRSEQWEEFKALRAEIAKLRAALKPFANLATFEGWNYTASTFDTPVYENDNGKITRADFIRAFEAFK